MSLRLYDNTGGLAVGNMFAAQDQYGSLSGTISATLGGVAANFAGSSITPYGVVFDISYGVIPSFTFSYLPVVGTMQSILGGVTMSVNGGNTSNITGTLNSTLGGVTMAATSPYSTTGTMAATLGAVTLRMSEFYVPPPSISNVKLRRNVSAVTMRID